jgi:cobalamin-dependent methionine synthase I
MAVTLGVGIDMLLRRKSVTSPSEHFVCDGVASALAEAAADEAERIFLEGGGHRPRFSPGYGDLPLTIQRDVLSLCDAERLLGIRLTDTLLMIPTKSITAIIGRCD